MSHCPGPKRSTAHSIGPDPLWLRDALVPIMTVQIEELVVGRDETVGVPVVAQRLPVAFVRIELERLGRQGQDGNIGQTLMRHCHVNAIGSWLGYRSCSTRQRHQAAS
jgi:hypothetical protein